MPPDPPSGSRLRRSRAPPLILPLLRHCDLKLFCKMADSVSKSYESVGNLVPRVLSNPPRESGRVRGNPGNEVGLLVEETRNLSYLETFSANIKKVIKGTSNFIQAAFEAWITERSQNNQKKGEKCLKAVMDRMNVPRSNTFALLFLQLRRNDGNGRLLESRRLKGSCSSCSEEKSPMVPNPDPKQDNWKNDISLFPATNKETSLTRSSYTTRLKERGD